MPRSPTFVDDQNSIRARTSQRLCISVEIPHTTTRLIFTPKPDISPFTRVGPSMDASDLKKTAELLAQLLRQLAEQETLSYREQSDASGVSRNVIYYFAKRSDDPSSIKTSDLCRLLEWSQSVNFDNYPFSKKQQETAKELSKLFGAASSATIESLANAFTPSESLGARLKIQFPNYLLGFRERGTTSRVQISVHRLFESSDRRSIHWTMSYLQGLAPTDGGHPPEREDQDLAEVQGLATLEKQMLSCVGVRRGTRLVNVMNVFVPDGMEPEQGSLLLGSYCTFSRDEAISRLICLQDTGTPIDKPPSRFTGSFGDITAEKLKRKYPGPASVLLNKFRGYSINSEGVKLHPKELHETVYGNLR